MADPLPQRRADSVTPPPDGILRQRRPVGPPPLRPAPEAAPPLREPSMLGGLAGYKPTATLGEQVGRWYENSGGLNAAVQKAQESQQKRDPKVLDGLLWPKWKPEDVNKRAPVTTSDTDPYYKEAGNDGWHDPNSGSIWLRDGAPNKASVLGHELGHHVYARDADTVVRQQAAAEDGVSGWHMPHGGDKKSDYYRYTLEPAEVDVRLAEIKRHYAHHTGRLVDSPEEAQKAWDWWSSYRRNFTPGVNEHIERPEDAPTLDMRTFDRYDTLPPQMKQQMLHRMPELVQSGDRIRDLQREATSA